MASARSVLIPLGLALLLQACASRPPVADTPQHWPAHQARVSALEDWDLRGRLNIRSDTESRTLGLRWLQYQDDLDIALSGTLGMGAVSIQGDGSHLVIERSGEAPVVADDLDALSEAYLGYDFPLGNLLWWVRGLMSPDSPHQAEFNDLQVLGRLQQDGWVIDYDRYQQVDNLVLPGRIRLSRSPWQLTFLISDWSFESTP